jgi:outer membrane protein
MQKIFFLLIILVSLNINAIAQLNIAYVDSDTIMKEYPDAKDAQQKIDALILEWQDEIAKMEAAWQRDYDDYEKRKLILSDQKRVELEKDLVALEDQISKFKQTKFGVNGELFAKQNEIMKPIQNKVFNVINDIAQEEDYDFVFDRSGDMMFVFAKEEYDITALVLDKLIN